MRISIVVPTLNPGLVWEAFADALLENLRQCRIKPGRVLVIDSASTDKTRERAMEAGFQVLSIARGDFDHGGTRQLAVLQAADADFLIFLTQDALLASGDALANLLAAFHNPTVGAAYGRQLPRHGASDTEAHARLFNYPDASKIRSFQDRKTMGLKSVFASNSFCAYRRTALLDVGGFPSRVICGEDTITVGRMHMAGWCSAYVADAQVYHSHRLSILEEARRYFDTGVTHARNPFMLEVFGTAGGEGKRFVLSELRYLLKKNPWNVPEALLRTFSKLASYQMGRKESRMSLRVCRALSLNRRFWEKEHRGASVPELPGPLKNFLAGPPPFSVEEKAAHASQEERVDAVYRPGLEAGARTAAANRHKASLGSFE